MMQERLFLEVGSLLGSKPGSAIVKTGHLFGVFRIFVCLLRAWIGVQCNRKFQFRVTGILLLDRARNRPRYFSAALVSFLSLS